MNILMLIYPHMTPLDLLGPLQVFSQLPEANIQTVWKHTQAIPTDTGLDVLASHDFDHAFIQPDIVFVPGGGQGAITVMQDDEVLCFLKQRAAKAQWVTAVCTGSLILGAAGLLDGYQATSHWASLEALTDFGATPVSKRWVKDRNRMTGGGVTAGIDFALSLVAELTDEDTAKAIQLGLEYNPQPPFNAGSPDTVEPHILQYVLEGLRHWETIAKENGQPA